RLLPLAEMARDRRPDADGHRRPRRIEPSRAGLAGRPGAGRLPHTGHGGVHPRRPHAAGLGLPARVEIAAVLDRPAGGAAGTTGWLKPLTGDAYLMVLRVDSIRA